MTTREAVVREALTWEGTPYHHGARQKGVGVDCAMLPAAVYEACELAPRLDPEYSPQWYLHRDEELYLQYILPHAVEITFEELGPGDLIVWKFGRTYSHSAIVLDYPEVLHAVRHSRSVIRGNADRDFELVDRPRRFFTLWSNR